MARIHALLTAVFVSVGLPAIGAPIHDAASAGDAARVSQILHSDRAAMYDDTAAGGSPFRLAALLGQVAVMQALLDAGADINRTDSTGEAPLHAAAGNRGYPGNYLETVQFLLDHRADVNVRDTENGWTPLHRAVERGRPEILPLLLSHGASVTARDESKNTPLLILADHWQRPKLVIARLLVDKGADVNAANIVGYTFLHKLALSGFSYTWPEARVGTGRSFNDFRTSIADTLQVTEYLMSRGAKIDARTHDGITPLFFAANKEKPELVELLLKLGADVNAVDKSGSTPLKFLIPGRSQESANVLRRYGGHE